MEIYIGWERIFGGIYIDGETPLLIEVWWVKKKISAILEDKANKYFGITQKMALICPNKCDVQSENGLSQ